jgi:DNA-binding CsgD family transcriptional regulator
MRPPDHLAETDPAYPIVAAILRVVPASRWAFARPEADGHLAHLLGSRKNGGELAELQDENSRQRSKVKTGSRIAAMLGPLGDYESGVTLLFADGRENFGILTLLRTSELGPFTSSEITVLTLALDASSERLSALRLNPRRQAHLAANHRVDPPNPAESPGGEHYILDRDLQIVMTWTSQQQRRAALTGLRMRLAERLPSVLEETVRELIAGWQSDPATQVPGIARPVPFLVVRTEPVEGPSGLFVGVRIDRVQPAHSLSEPAARFHISTRELEVLALLLDGIKVEEIAEILTITASTVQDHIKSMIDKTESRNRSELIARVLGWDSTPEDP